MALCFGWIDAVRRSDDERHFLQRYTPRSARSTWSQINRDKVLRYIAEGRMQPAGLAEIERAQRDGRWDAAYAPVSRLQVPADLQQALDAVPGTQAFLERLDSRNRYAILLRTHMAKRADTRARRIANFVAMLARGEKIYP